MLYLFERKDIESYFKSDIYRLSGFRTYVLSGIERIIKMDVIVQHKNCVYKKNIYNIKKDV